MTPALPSHIAEVCPPLTPFPLNHLQKSAAGITEYPQKTSDVLQGHLLPALSRYRAPPSGQFLKTKAAWSAVCLGTSSSAYEAMLLPIARLWPRIAGSATARTSVGPEEQCSW